MQQILLIPNNHSNYLTVKIALINLPIVTIKKPYLYRPPFLRKKGNIIIEAWSILFTEKFFVAFYQLVASFSYKVTSKAAQIEKFKLKRVRLEHLPPVDLCLIFEKSSCKNQVRQTGFLATKNQYRNWFLQATQAVKIQFEID